MYSLLLIFYSVLPPAEATLRATVLYSSFGACNNALLQYAFVLCTCYWKTPIGMQSGILFFRIFV